MGALTRTNTYRVFAVQQHSNTQRTVANETNTPVLLLSLLPELLVQDTLGVLVCGVEDDVRGLVH